MSPTIEVIGSVETWDRPIPAPDAVTAEYWKAASDGRLLFQQCPSCDHRQFYPRALCTSCGETPRYVEASGRGVVHTFTVIRQNYARPFNRLAPYVVAMIELEEGPRMMTNIVDCEVEDVQVGMQVEVVMQMAAEDVAVPFWRPASS